MEVAFTDSGGNSSGKFGPFVGDVTQVFADEQGSGTGKYANIVSFFNDSVVISLEAIAEPTKDDTLKVTFLTMAVKVGPDG